MLQISKLEKRMQAGRKLPRLYLLFA